MSYNLSPLQLPYFLVFSYSRKLISPCRERYVHITHFGKPAVGRLWRPLLPYLWVHNCNNKWDLQIVFFVRIESRIESAVYHAVTQAVTQPNYTYSEYLIHRYFVFVTNESDVRTTELRTEYLFISIQS